MQAPWGRPWLPLLQGPGQRRGAPLRARPLLQARGACRQALVNLCVLDRLLLTLGSRGPHITDGGTGSESRPAQSPEAHSRRPSFLLPSGVPSLSSCAAV